MVRVPPCVCFELTPVCAPTLSLFLSESVSECNKLVSVWYGCGSLCVSQSMCTQSVCLYQELCGRKSEWVSLEICFSLRGPCGSGAVMKICVYQCVYTGACVCHTARALSLFREWGCVYQAVLVCMTRCVCARDAWGGGGLCAPEDVPGYVCVCHCRSWGGYIPGSHPSDPAFPLSIAAAADARPRQRESIRP